MKSKLMRIVFLALLAVSVIVDEAAAQESPLVVTVRAAAVDSRYGDVIERIFVKWGDTNIHPDLEGFISLWDENAVKMTDGKPVLNGLSAIKEYKRKGFEAVTYERFVVGIDEVQPAGEFMWASGTYWISTRPKSGGDAMDNQGMFLTIFKHQADGSWKVYRDLMMSAPR